MYYNFQKDKEEGNKKNFGQIFQTSMYEFLGFFVDLLQHSLDKL